MDMRTRNKTLYPEYYNWRSMIKRVNYPQGYYYKLEVHPDWLDFFTFLDYIGRKPSGKHTLDRIDNSKGYIPGNVRWATKTEQQLNRSVQKNSKTGIKGVSLRRGKYRVVFMRKDIGIYNTIQEAQIAYNKARDDYLE